MFTLCNIESAHQMKENCCKLFLKEDYEILSYLIDLKQYWLKSYGNELNAKMVFLLIQDMFNQIDAYVNNQTETRVFLRFGHAENIFPLATALGLFKEEDHLYASNFEYKLKRRFKSAYMSPFSSNIAFVLNKCKNNDFKMSVFVNELPLSQLDAGNLECSLNKNHSITSKLNKSVCDLEDLRNQLNNYIKYEYSDVCNLKIAKSEL